MTDQSETRERTTTDPLRSIGVLGLFRLFDHHIDLSPHSTVTVIHGPNGVGKTIVLRMIRDVFAGVPNLIHRIPFDQFILRFESGDEFALIKTYDADLNKSSIRYLATIAGKPCEGVYEAFPSEKAARMIADRLRGGPWSYQGEGHWLDNSDGEEIDYATALSRLLTLAPVNSAGVARGLPPLILGT